jgi:hypothetical protein
MDAYIIGKDGDLGSDNSFQYQQVDNVNFVLVEENLDQTNC